MYKYGTIIYWSEEDQAFIAKVPQLPGCVAYGDSPGEALNGVDDAVRLWIDAANEFGDEIPERRDTA